jgi:hypothetical protein
MKSRLRKVANFFAFNLLFFALYLNFIHRDNYSITGGDQSAQPTKAAFSGTVLVDNPEQYLQKKSEATVSVSTANPSSVKTEQNNGPALRLSIN